MLSHSREIALTFDDVPMSDGTFDMAAVERLYVETLCQAIEFYGALVVRYIGRSLIRYYCFTKMMLRTVFVGTDRQNNSRGLVNHYTISCLY